MTKRKQFFFTSEEAMADRIGPTKRERETAKRRELGLCIICGQPAAPKATCDECGQRANEYRKNRKKKMS